MHSIEKRWQSKVTNSTVATLIPDFNITRPMSFDRNIASVLKSCTDDDFYTFDNHTLNADDIGSKFWESPPSHRVGRLLFLTLF
jgi:hypothetical protein